MRKLVYFIITVLFCAHYATAANGDTTYIKAFDKVSFTRYGNFDQWGVFPAPAKKFQRILMKYTVSCESNGQCEWDYTNTIYIRQNTGLKDSTLKKATTFRIAGQAKDSVNYSTDTTWTTSYNKTTKKTDSVASAQLVIVRYAFVSQSQPEAFVDTLKVWPVQYYKVYYDSTGKKTDSAYVPVQQTLRAVYTDYYSVFDRIIDYEMGRMITPYAKAGTLPRPFAYEYLYDVTDYASLLHDSAQVRLNYSGYSWGFTGTIEFFMVEGTPAREAYKVENVWDGYFAYGNDNDPIENHLMAKTFTKDANTSSVKMRMTITGHGSGGGCAEFCEKFYTLKLNSGTVDTRTVWKDDCGSNPIINQGGTWIYDRANWCPGMIVKPYEYNLNTVSGSNTIDVDMEEFSTSGSAGYAYGAQLIYYKSNAFTVDAGIETILAPTTEFVYNRTNPICDNARIMIRNFGTQALTTAVIKYQVGNADPQTFNWTGSLAFDEKTEVVLPAMNWINPSAEKKFKVWIDQANGQADENSFNNTKVSAFTLPDVMPLTFVVETKTNANPEENAYTIKTSFGELVTSKTFDTANKLYRDTITVGYGCYTFSFDDSGKDGLSFWANTSQGTGTLRFVKLPVSSANTLKSFNADFGNFVNFNFRAGTPVGVEDVQVADAAGVSIYPQPASEVVHVRSEQLHTSAARLLSLDGRLVKQFSEAEAISGDLDLSDVSTGIYLLDLATVTGQHIGKKLGVIR